MRSFIITAFLFFLMLGVIFFNKQYVESSAAFIIECVKIENLENDPLVYAEKLENFWNKNMPKLGLSVGFKELDRMSELIIDLKAYMELGNAGEVMRTAKLIEETADDISRLERFTLENML